MSSSHSLIKYYLLAESADKVINCSQLEVRLWRSYGTINPHLLIHHTEEHNSVTLQLTQQFPRNLQAV